jgi:hypothetical protein
MSYGVKRHFLQYFIDVMAVNTPRHKRSLNSQLVIGTDVSLYNICYMYISSCLLQCF